MPEPLLRLNLRCKKLLIATANIEHTGKHIWFSYARTKIFLASVCCDTHDEVKHKFKNQTTQSENC
jgi:hypothetical protein